MPLFYLLGSIFISLTFETLYSQEASWAPSSTFQLANQSDLQTWWHYNSVWNDGNPVPHDQVRRSHRYHVRVGFVEEPQTAYDSFTYISIPRNGMPASSADRPDGAEFASQENLTMSWSSFLYQRDVYVYVQRLGQTALTSDSITIRPTSLDLETQIVDPHTVRIKVPYRAEGLRFSLEFKDDLYTAYLNEEGTLNTREGRSIHQEPRHALLIFANPKPKDPVARPDSKAPDVWIPQEGQLDIAAMEGYRTVYFRPGTYYLPPASHAYLPASVEWIYLAPGAYVKGAFEFRGDRQNYKVTGEGVLSGEMYEYEPDRRHAYRRTLEKECHGDCVKMLQFFSNEAPQRLHLEGVTLANPPYHSFVVYGNSQSFTMNVLNFKQVGAWYWQTDGIELYQGSSMKHAFLHSNDDVIKLYHSDLIVEDIVVWKAENGPVVQFGWTPRSFENVHVKDIAIIHNRMYWPNVTHNHCIINAARDYRDPSSFAYADSQHRIRNLFLENIRSEGLNLCAMRLYALSNWENIHIKNLWIEAWNQLPHEAQQSQFRRLWQTDGTPVRIGNESQWGMGLKIENFQVGKQTISKWNDSWQADQLGRLNFDAELWDYWNAW